MTEIMKYIPKDTKGWSMPSSVIAVQVEKETYPAKLPSEYTPKDMITTEYFVRGTQPTQVSERYQKLNDISNPSVDVKGNKATISWNYTTPNALTDEYLNNYFSQSIFQKSKENLINERKTYNKNILGNIVFGIYKETEDGTLELLAYTDEYSYIYEGYESATIIIKAEHQKYKNNASAGTKLNITLNNNAAIDNITATLDGKTTISTIVGSYTESGIKNVYYKSINVTKQSTIKYQLLNNNIVSEYMDINALQRAVNQLSAGEYTIKYVITYRDKEIYLTRTIILK